MEKTNVMRLLDTHKIKYIVHEYDAELTDGEQVAVSIGQDPDMVFKTLVTVGNDNQNYVFVIPVNCILNLKKASKSVGVKSIDMIKQKELLPITGYVHGGCSPVGMKKVFPTVINDTATLFDEITFSAGKRGLQVQLSPQCLTELIGSYYDDIID
jgi:Cys-tRNA(Pro)/Cys-tRNA(Cys) deacylase